MKNNIPVCDEKVCNSPRMIKAWSLGNSPSQNDRLLDISFLIRISVLIYFGVFFGEQELSA